MIARTLPPLNRNQGADGACQPDKPETNDGFLERSRQCRKDRKARLARSQRLKSVGLLTEDIAHDLGNLLTPIRVISKLLQKEQPPEKKEQLLQALQASAERASELVQRLAAFAGGVELDRKTVQVKDVISEILPIVEHTFPKTIVVRNCTATDLPPVLADSTQLVQVLMNLCVNARDAMPAGGTLSVGAEAVVLDDEYVREHSDSHTRNFVRVTVEDTGCGMDRNVLDRAFCPFFTTKAREKGTGLGLSIALGIVRSHGGFLCVDSQVGNGSRFSVYLPVP